MVLTNIYQKIKNNNKKNNYNELLEKINNYNFLEEDILKKYLINRYDKIDEKDLIDTQKTTDFIVNISRFTTIDKSDKNTNININKEDNRLTLASPIKDKNNKKHINNNLKEDELLYEFKECEKDQYMYRTAPCQRRSVPGSVKLYL